MTNILAPVLSRVLRVRVEGKINQKLYQLSYLFRTDSITAGFKKAFWVKPEALVVTISSVGGSLTQAKNIADILRLYSNQKK